MILKIIIIGDAEAEKGMYHTQWKHFMCGLAIFKQSVEQAAWINTPKFCTSQPLLVSSETTFDDQYLIFLDIVV